MDVIVTTEWLRELRENLMFAENKGDVWDGIALINRKLGLKDLDGWEETENR